MSQRIPLVFSTLALVIATTGVGPADAARAVKRALFADNASRVNGIKASRTAQPGHLVPLGPDGRFPAGVLAAGGARGPRGPQGPPGPILPAGGDLEGELPNPRVRRGAVTAEEVPNPYIFRAYKIAAQDTPTANSATVTLGGEAFDPHGDFNPGTSTYTVPVDGAYQFSASISMCCGGGRMLSQIDTNRPDARIRGSDYTASGYHQSVASGLLQLKRGDIVKLAIYTSGVNQLGATDLTFLSGHLVAPD